MHDATIKTVAGLQVVITVIETSNGCDLFHVGEICSEMCCEKDYGCSYGYSYGFGYSCDFGCRCNFLNVIYGLCFSNGCVIQTDCGAFRDRWEIGHEHNGHEEAIAFALGRVRGVDELEIVEIGALGSLDVKLVICDEVVSGHVHAVSVCKRN